MTGRGTGSRWVRGIGEVPDSAVSAGGEMTCRTLDPVGAPWRTGIQDPVDPDRIIAGSLTDADVDATAAYASGPDAARWLSTRPGRTGLVVWADGTTTVVPPPVSA